MRWPESLVLASALAITVAACENVAPTAGAAPEAPPIVGVTVRAIVPTAVAQTVEAVGTVRSKTQATIASKLTGYVREVLVREGDRVDAGQLLVKIDDVESRARVDGARAALQAARDGLDETARMLDEGRAALRSADAEREYAGTTARRYRTLLDGGLISAQDFDGADARRRGTEAAADQAHARILSLESRQAQAQQRIDQARAELAMAEVQLADTRITAPMAGVITERHVEPGNLAAPGQPLLGLDDSRNYRLEAVVSESDIARVAPGQPVDVALDAPARTVAGRVVTIVPAADPTSRNVTVKIDLPSVAGLRSGAFGRAAFLAGTRARLVVPRPALVERGQLLGVYVVDPGSRARLRLVTTGQRYGDGIEILSGLTAGERIVTDGADRVVDGRRVQDG